MKTEIGELLILKEEGTNHSTTWHIVQSLKTQKHYVVGFLLPLKLGDTVNGLKESGYVCTCPRFRYGGLRCKHVDFVEERSQLNLDDWPF